MEDRDEAVRALVRQADRALGELASIARCPDHVDRFDWSADLLDGLARAAVGIGSATAVITGGTDDELDALARQLATAIVRRRNEALVPLPSPRRALPGRLPHGA